MVAASIDGDPSTKIIVRGAVPLDLRAAHLAGKMRAVLDDIRRHNVGNDVFVQTLGIGLLGGGNILAYGQPGVNKTGVLRMLAERLHRDDDALAVSEDEYLEAISAYEPETRAIGTIATANGFHRKFYNAFTEPHEILGVQNFQAMEKGYYIRHRRGSILRAAVHFAEEFGEAGSSIKNAMLGLFDETPTYDEDGVTYHLTRLLLVVAATNKTLSRKDEPGIIDRFPFKVAVLKSQDRDDKLSILHRHYDTRQGRLDTTPLATIAEEEIRELRAYAREIEVPEGIFELLATLDDDLRAAGLEVSPRMLNRCLDALQAHALLAGRGGVTNKDMGILTYMVADWNDQQKARQIILDATAPREAEANAFYNELGSDAGQWLQNAASAEKKKRQQAAQEGEDRITVVRQGLAKLKDTFVMAEQEGYDVENILVMVRDVEGVIKDMERTLRELKRELR